MIRSILLCLLLAACGGGDPDHPEHTEKATPPDCAASGACK